MNRSGQELGDLQLADLALAVLEFCSSLLWKIMMPARLFSGLMFVLFICASTLADASDDGAYPSRVYWGDTHVHTYLSADAYSLGTRVTPDTAYRFARGDKVTADNGQRVQLNRPLDFLMVAVVPCTD